RAQPARIDRTYLSSLAVHLEPTVMVGKDGLSEGVTKALEQELAFRELVKLRFVASKEDRKEISQELATAVQAELVRVIGNVAIFYRPALEIEKRTIVLP
ncbi:MAG: YhbY family RNA-binding protein, partial [Termitinemataceae bacterium]